MVFPVITIGGYYFLMYEKSNILWENAWFMYSIASALVFFNSIILSFLEGCNLVHLIQKFRGIISLTNAIVTVVCLHFGFGLYTLPITLLISFLLGFFFIVINFSYTIKQLLCIKYAHITGWSREVWPLLWRYAVSWGCGYFIFQLFTPLAFRFCDTVFAGKIGISMSMWIAGYTLASSWIVAITPKINMLVSEKKWTELDLYFNKKLKMFHVKHLQT